MTARSQTGGGRTLERLRQHLVERQLAERLRRAGKEERQHLYSTVYDELFRQVPDHPQSTRRANPAAQAEAVMTRTSLARRVYRALPAPPSTNYNLDQLGVDPYALIPTRGTVLDVGAGTAGGRYAFTNRGLESYGLRYVATDLAASPGIGCVADAHHLPFAARSIDAVICVSTLEYVQSPTQVIAECYRVLKPRGLVYLSAPFVFPYHPPPADRYRFSISGLRTLAADFEEIRVGTNRGPCSTFCHVLVHFLAIALSFNSVRVYGLLLDLFKWLFFWLKYADRWIGRYEVALVLHGGSFFLGRKPERS